ncbi:MAG TPA: hypothetical protein VLU06_03320 [Thermoanaerobaculia bacterium]|nr:hypothetical protein [Thermoanaerobaculia bacterium]
MSELSALILRVSLAEVHKGPWAVVLAGGQAVRLRQAFDPDGGFAPTGAAPRDVRALAGGDARDEVLRRHRDRQWH